MCDDLQAALLPWVEGRPAGQVFVLADEHTHALCLPHLLERAHCLHGAHVVTVPAGDEHKTLDTATHVWRYLSEHGATRASLLVNLGGGMVTDLGGFAASTFKRGMDYVNLPTTLLGAVDAATGGKTGVNFLGLKNEIGVFAPARAVLVHVDFLRTLDGRNLLSGFAEMVKHALLDSREAWAEVLRFDLERFDLPALKPLLGRNIAIKERIVAQDPTERGLRKALNLGHTFGHAFESLSYRIYFGGMVHIKEAIHLLSRNAHSFGQIRGRIRFYIMELSNNSLETTDGGSDTTISPSCGEEGAGILRRSFA